MPYRLLRPSLSQLRGHTAQQRRRMTLSAARRSGRSRRDCHGTTVAPRFGCGCGELAPSPSSSRTVVSRFPCFAPASMNASRRAPAAGPATRERSGHPCGPTPFKGRLNRHDADGAPLVKRRHRSASQSTGIAMTTDGAIAAPDRHVAGRLAWTGMQSSCRMTTAHRSPPVAGFFCPFVLT